MRIFTHSFVEMYWYFRTGSRFCNRITRGNRTNHLSIFCLTPPKKMEKTGRDLLRDWGQAPRALHGLIGHALHPRRTGACKVESRGAFRPFSENLWKILWHLWHERTPVAHSKNQRKSLSPSRLLDSCPSRRQATKMVSLETIRLVTKAIVSTKKYVVGTSYTCRNTHLD